jgi:uncharacterized lipoprotein YajG
MVFFQIISYPAEIILFQFSDGSKLTKFLRRLTEMKSKLIVILFIALFALVGCSSGGSKSNTPDDKIATINSMMSKGYEMSDNQRNNINKAVEEAKKLISQQKIDEANALLKKTINTLELIAETDRFNKSE